MEDQLSETTTEPTSSPEGAPATGEQSLGDPGKAALAAERKAKKDAEKRASELETRLKEFEDRDKTEAQRLAERAAAAEGALTPLQQENAKLRIALEKGIPAKLVHRLQGSTEEELAADADELLALVGNPVGADDSAPAPRTPRPDLSQGATSSAPLNGDAITDSLKTALGIR